jgi:hypothetical protein
MLTYPQSLSEGELPSGKKILDKKPRNILIAILLISLLTITVFPFSISQTSKERPRPRPPTTNKALSELIKEKYSGLKFVNTPTVTKESQLKTMPVSQVKVDPSLTQKIASAGPLGKVPVIVEFNAGVAKPADIRKGSAFMSTFAGAAIATASGSALVQTGFYPQVNAFEANVTANLVNALSRMPQVAHIYDPTQKVKALNYYSTYYHQAVISWAYDSIGTGAIVAVLDTGWDNWASYTTTECSPSGCGPHPDLQNLASVYTSVAVRDFTTTTPPYDAHDYFGHGTHVEGIAVGQGIVDSKQTGIAPGAKLMVGKVLDDTGSGYWSWVIRGMIWANGIDPDSGYPTALKANVISMSLGGACGYGDGTSIVEQVVDEVARQGSLPVIAAGNSGPVGMTICVPGSSKNAVTVGATYWDLPSAPYPWMLTDFSSRGPTYDYRDKPDLSAIGYYVNSTIPPASSIFGTGDWPPYYGCISGTSMATPQVSGGGADLASGRPNAQTDALKAMLLSTWQGAYDMQNSTHGGVGWDQAGLGFLQIDDSFHTEFYTGTVTAPYENYNAATNTFTYVGPGTWVYFKFWEPDPTVPIRVVLTWLDPSTSAGSATYGSTVHDLDLYLYDPSGHEVAWSDSYRNTIEYVDYSTGSNAVGTYTIGVHYYANRLGYDPTQHFAVSLRSACNSYGCFWGPPVAPITGETIASGGHVYMRPTDTLKASDTFKNLRASTDAWGTGGGLRGIDIEHWLYSDMTGWVWIGYGWVTVNPGATLTTTFSVPLASYHLPYGLYWLEEDAYAYYPTNGYQFVGWQDVGASYQDYPFYITPPMAAAMLSVTTNLPSYPGGASGTVTFRIQNVGTQPYTGTVSLLLMGPAIPNPVVIASKQVTLAVGGTLTSTITVYWPSNLPTGANAYTLVASTGTQGWTSTATTTVTISGPSPSGASR